MENKLEFIKQDSLNINEIVFLKNSRSRFIIFCSWESIEDIGKYKEIQISFESK